MTVTAEDAAEWAKVVDDDRELFDRVFAAVVGRITSVYALPAAPTDEQTADWDMAILLASARLWKRRLTPEGLIDTPLGGVIRIGGFDRDEQALLAQFEIWAIG